jgi:hypothetical protein
MMSALTTGRAAACWREAAAAVRDVGDYEEAARLERLAANAQARPPRWWQRAAKSSEI